MMTFGCGCREISRTPIEFKIESCPQVHINCGPLLPNTNDKDFDTLQRKIVCDFKKVIKQLECGIQPDIEIILEEISLLFMNGCGYNVAKKMYSTDIEDDYFLRHDNFLSEFDTQEEKNQVLLNLGIYDKLQNMISKQEVNNMVLNINNDITTLRGDIDNRIIEIVNQFNLKLDTKIGFIKKVNYMYYGFASEESYNEWLQNGSDHSSRLILGSWVAANYVPNEYVIILHVGENDIQTETVKEGFSYIIPTPIKQGYKFTKWTTNSDGSGISYLPEQIIVVEKSLELFANWTQTCTVTIHANEGSTPSTTTYEVDYGSTITLPSETVRSGYNFIGWNTLLNGTGTNYEAEESITVTSDLDLYANWEKLYTIVLYDGENIIQTYNEPLNKVITLPNQTKNHYTFLGWNTQQTGGTGHVNGQYTVIGNAQLYAQWKQIIYTITFNLDGGSGTVQQMSGTYGTIISLPSYSGEKEGYILGNEWLYNGTSVGAFGDAYTIIGNKTLKVKWIENLIPDTLIMYSFTEQKENNFNTSDVTTNLIKDDYVEVSTARGNHYIPCPYPITVVEPIFGQGDTKIGDYDNINHVYKIERTNLRDKLIKYN